MITTTVRLIRSTRLERAFGTLVLACALAGCAGGSDEAVSEPAEHAGTEEPEAERGPNGGRMLRDGDFAIELAIFETGVPPEFRAWISEGGKPVAPQAVDLRVALERLGGRVDEIVFAPQGDFLRGDRVVEEPHSFVVSVEAVHDGEEHHFQYDSFEGRTRIGAEVAEAFGLETLIAGPAVLEERLTLYGRIVPDAEKVREVSARFDGAIRAVGPALGDSVRAGEVLATVESNESLRAYDVTAPIAGVVIERAANPGEQTAGRVLFTLVDTSSVWAELAVYPGDRERVKIGADVTVRPATGGQSLRGKIARIGIVAGPSQSVPARVVLDNADGALLPGMYVTADVEVGQHEVPLAVKRSALQSFRDFTVVYAQYGEEYEVRMLELGRQAGDWAEVLGGLEAGTRYVAENSYVLKADVEKSGASHDH